MNLGLCCQTDVLKWRAERKRARAVQKISQNARKPAIANETAGASHFVRLDASAKTNHQLHEWCVLTFVDCILSNLCQICAESLVRETALSCAPVPAGRAARRPKAPGRFVSRWNIKGATLRISFSNRFSRALRSRSAKGDEKRDNKAGKLIPADRER